MKIILFGTGCELCQEIAENVEMAIQSSAQVIEFEKCSDLHRMLSYGIKSTPSLVIDKKVISVSQPLSIEQITKFIEEATNA